MTRVVRFKADDVELDPQVGFVGFADSVNRRYFWIQPDEESTAKDRIWLERDDQAWGGTGGRWTVTMSRTRLVVDTRHLPWMACDAIEIEYSVDDTKYELLRRILKQVMESCPVDLRIED